MDSMVLLQQMLVLFAMMAAGYLSFKLHYFDRLGQHQISTLLVKVMNPFLLLNSIAGGRTENSGALSREAFFLALLYYAYLFLFSLIYVKVRRFPKKQANMQQLLIDFSNVGFLSIPLIRALFGDGYVIYLVFYLLFFNIFVYTVGVFLAGGLADNERPFEIRKIFNIGTVASALAILLYLLDVRLPVPAVTFCSYMGNACIPLSMILIGASLAQADLKQIFRNPSNYVFAFVRMLLIPAAGILIFRNLPFHREMLYLFFILLSMPPAAMAGMLAEEYGHKGNEANEIIAMTTLMAVMTIPLLSLLYI